MTVTVSAIAAVDLDDPPVGPPADCSKATMWHRASGIRAAPTYPGGHLPYLPTVTMCSGLEIASAGMATALRVEVDGSAYWRRYEAMHYAESWRIA